MYIKIKVFPKSKRNDVVERSEDAFIIYTKAKAERGEANEAVQKLLSNFLSIPLHRIHLVKGSKSPNKIFEIKQ